MARPDHHTRDLTSHQSCGPETKQPAWVLCLAPAIGRIRRVRALYCRLKPSTPGQGPHAPEGTQCSEWDPVFHVRPGTSGQAGHASGVHCPLPGCVKLWISSSRGNTAAGRGNALGLEFHTLFRVCGTVCKTHREMEKDKDGGIGMHK